MSDTELIYELEADPPPAEKFFAALQHVLASFVGIITPTLIIGGALGLGEQIPYLISMALMQATPSLRLKTKICPLFS